MTSYFEQSSISTSNYAAYNDAVNIRRENVTQLQSLKKYSKHSMMINNRLLSNIRYEFNIINPANNQNELWHIRLAKAKDKWEASQQFLCLESEHAQYWVSDGLNFLAHLTGIHLKEGQLHMLNMVLPKIPEPIQSIFSWKLASMTTVPADICRLDFHYGSVDVALKAKLAVDNQACLDLINHACFKSAKLKPLSREISISAPVPLGCFNIGMMECSQLKAGDLVFIEHENFNANGSGSFSLGPFTLYSQIELVDGQYHLAINRWERTMTDENTLTENEEPIREEMEVSYKDDDVQSEQEDDENSDSDKLPIGDIPIKVDVRLGSVKFTVKELNNIVEGRLYLINSPGKGIVQLVHNEMEVARGQLVEVDGKLAIEIQRHWLQA